MIQIKYIVTILCLVLAVVNSIPFKLPPAQCNLSDGDCKRLMYQSLFRQLVGGDPDRDIPKADPISVNEIVSILPNGVKFSLEEGILTGFKDCDFEEMKTHLGEKFYSVLNVTCDLKISGLTKVYVPKAVIEELGGEDVTADINGQGKGTIIMNRLHLLLNVPFVLKWSNNDVYLHGQNLSIKHDAKDIIKLENIEDLNVENKGNADKIVDYLKEKVNEMDLLAPITEKMLKFFEAFMENFLATIPAKTLFSGDLSSFT